MLERSKLLGEIGSGLVHGFTDRNGGVSTGRFATLNVGGKWGDDPAAVSANRIRIAEAAGFNLAALRMATQVHGSTVLAAKDIESGSEADALWCERDDALIVAVMTADCVPVLIADRRGTVACAVHSGWRGTVAGIVTSAVGALQAAGVAPDALVAAVGPSIEQKAFEVGPEVAEQFDERYVDRSPERPHVDLVACVTDQLGDAGVSSVERVGRCTHANEDRYFSYRRDGAGIGQMMAFIGFGRESLDGD